MISRVIRKTVNLDAIQKVDQLEGPLYQLEESGHTFEITCMSGGAAAAVSGTVSGRFLRADETTVYFTGTLSGNVASLTLPQSCYNVNGRFGLVVFISGYDVTSAIYAVAGNVYRSTSDTIIDPTGEIPSLEELMAQIEACEEATASAQQAASFVNSIIAPTYSTGVPYAIGDYFTYEGSMYRCTAATSGEFDPSDLEMVLVGGEFKRVDEDVDDLKSAINALDDIVLSECDLSSKSTINYNIGPSTGKWTQGNNYDCYYFNVPTGARIARIKSNANNGTVYALLSTSDTHTHGSYPSYATGCTRTFINAGNVADIVVPSDCKYIWITKTLGGTNYSPQYLGFNSDLSGYNDLEDYVEEIKPYMPSEEKIKSISDFSTGYYIDGNVGDTWTSNLVSNSGSLYTSSAIDLVDYLGNYLIFEIGGSDAHSGVREWGFCNSQNKITSVHKETSIDYVASGNVLRANASIEDRYFFFSCSSKSLLNIYVASNGEIIKTIYARAYISPEGSDSNPGTYAFPLATIDKALSNGAKRIGVLGGKYSQQINLGLAKYPDIEIFNVTPTKKAVFYAPGCVIATSETSVSGYTKVYSAETTKTFADNNVWIFQDGVADESTEITAAERMPEQRGYKYRCYDTKIVKCSSENLSDALTEIENATICKWYLDSGTLYFSRPESVSESNPICGSFNTGLFASNPGRVNSIRMTGIDIKYMSCNINNTANSVLKDCSCCNVYGDGCFVMSRAVESMFVRCEAARAFAGTNGDGFNGHSDNTNDAFAHQTTATLIDCWSHDNRDDGISLHERSEFTVIGGLFEQNAYGGGVTPANGSHCTCIGVTARKNGEGGFLYMNETSVAEGGVGGQIKCIDCVSDSNNTWAAVYSAGFKIGSPGNKGIMINCKAMNEDYAYYVASDEGMMTLMDCGALNCANVKGGKPANITVQNTTLVS